MIRVFLFFLAVLGLALGAAWLADRPGEVVLQWQGWRIETSLMVLAIAIVAVAGLVMLVWSLVRWLLDSPSIMSDYFRGRRRERGISALSRGLIAAGAGDARRARHYAGEARRLMRAEPATLLLQAQSAQLSGDRAAARKAFEEMLRSPETELLGLRGLYVEANRAGDAETARLYAERAVAQSPGLAWAGNAVLEFQTRDRDWGGALASIQRNVDNKLADRAEAKRARAVLLTAQALEREEIDPAGAMSLAQDAHKLAPDLVPAAVVAGRLAAEAGNTRQAARILEKSWKLSPHPDIAEVYAHARPGDSARDRLKRAQKLAGKAPEAREGRFAIAVAAIEAREWAVARQALRGLDGPPTRRACQLMAEIEDGENGDAGRVREWLSRALRAPRDPAWTADGYISDHWAPVSPVTGRLDAFEWKVPLEMIAADGSTVREEDYPDVAGDEQDAPMAVLETETQEHVEEEPADAPSETAETMEADAAEGVSPVAESEPIREPEKPRGPIPAPRTPPERGNGGHAPESRSLPGEAKAASPEDDETFKRRPPDDPGPEPEEDNGPPARRLF